jgi:YidC/Oxa1 family membrane protein insertase
MIVFFGLSLYVSQNLSGGGSTSAASDDPQVQQQQAVNKFTPVIFSGMFLFFPLPAGVLMYMAIGNVFQLAQTYLVNKEPLPPELQEESKKPKDNGDWEEPFAKSKKKKPT